MNPSDTLYDSHKSFCRSSTPPFLPPLPLLFWRKNGFTPNLRGANASKSGPKLWQMWCKWDKCHICTRICHPRANLKQMWHLPHLDHICYGFGPDLLTFTLRKYGANPLFRPVRARARPRLHACMIFNPLHPNIMISIHILHIVLNIFSKMLIRICQTIMNSFFSWCSIPWFAWLSMWDSGGEIL